MSQEWIPDLPAAWRHTQIRHLARVFAGGTPDRKNPDYWVNGSNPWLNSGAVNQDRITEPSEFVTDFAASTGATRWVRKGSVVVALAGQGKTKGMAARTEMDATLNQSLAAIEPGSQLNYRFLHYWLKANYRNLRGLAGGDLRDGLNLDHIGSVHVPLPPVEEQSLIADYLDRETAEIDAFMVDCSSMVTLLEEQELALEASLLTRGLNSSVSVIKDHGILWLEGESIPTHWTRMKLGFLLRMKSGDAISSEDIEAEGPYPVFGGGGFRGYTSTWNITGSHVLIGRQGALCGKVFVSAGDAFATEHAIVTYPKIDLDLRWLEGLLRFMNLGQYSQSAAQPGIGVESISKLYVPVPPLSEQVEIGASLADHQAKRSSLLLELQSAITLAHERRGALISAAVTGQVDVTSHGVSAAEQLRDELEVHV